MRGISCIPRRNTIPVCGGPWSKADASMIYNPGQIPIGFLASARTDTMESLVKSFFGDIIDIFCKNFDYKRDLSVNLSKAEAHLQNICASLLAFINVADDMRHRSERGCDSRDPRF